MSEEYRMKLQEELILAGYGSGGYWAKRLESIQKKRKG